MGCNSWDHQELGTAEHTVHKQASLSSLWTRLWRLKWEHSPKCLTESLPKGQVLGNCQLLLLTLWLWFWRKSLQYVFMWHGFESRYYWGDQLILVLKVKVHILGRSLNVRQPEMTSHSTPLLVSHFRTSPPPIKAPLRCPRKDLPHERVQVKAARIYMGITESLCCTAVINTTL